MLTVNPNHSSSIQNQKIFTNLDPSFSAFIHELKYNVNYSRGELSQFVSDDGNYKRSHSRVCSAIHHNLASNLYTARESDEVLQSFTLLVFSAQCVVVDLISENCHEIPIFDKFVNGLGIIMRIVYQLHLPEEILIDLLVITANRAFKNNLENNEDNNNLWHQVILSTALSYSSVEQISQRPAIDFSREVSWMGVLELFRSNQEIVRLGGGLKSPYFMRLDSLISLYRGLGRLDLVCSVLNTKRNTDKIYVNYDAFRKTVAMFCLKQRIINSNPYGFLQGVTDSCSDVEMTDEGYLVRHEGNLYVFKRAELVLDTLRKVGGDRFTTFIDYIESMLPSRQDKETHYVNLDRLNQMFDMMPILD